MTGLSAMRVVCCSAQSARAGSPCYDGASRNTGFQPVPVALRWQLLFIASTFLLFLLSTSARAYVEVPYTIGRVINESTTVVLMRVEKVDKEKHLIVYHKI